jgi:hypothetical protein
VQEGELAPGRHDQQAVGLGDPAGDLREHLRRRYANRDRQPDLLADPAAQPGGDRLRRPGDPPETADVEEGLVDRQALHHGRRVGEHLEHGPAGLHVRREARPDHDRVRTQVPGSAPAHRGADPEGPRLVAGREHDAPADHDRAVAQRGIVALLDRGEEGVEVGMQDRRLGC